MPPMEPYEEPRRGTSEWYWARQFEELDRLKKNGATTPRWLCWAILLLCLAAFCFCIYASLTLPHKLAQRETVTARKIAPEITPPAEAKCWCERCRSSLP